MEKRKEAHVLLVGKRNRKVKQVERILAEHFIRVSLASQLTDIIRLPDSPFDLIVVTDSPKDNLCKDFLLALGNLFPQARVICLFDKITQDIEIIIRSTGLLFLGSYDHFGQWATDILQSATGAIGGRGGF